MQLDSVFLSEFDCLVMLTWSDWHTELRGNRYHYATRFAAIGKEVIFVQPDLPDNAYYFEQTEIPRLQILHISNQYNNEQSDLLNKALLEKYLIRPIFWIYNHKFLKVIRNRFSVLNIYHATEDYLSLSGTKAPSDETFLVSLREMLEFCQLIVTVSPGIHESFAEQLDLPGKIITVTNGCDYKFYHYSEHAETVSKNVIFYQGNIFSKLDYELLKNLAFAMPEMEFRFCGKVYKNEQGWQELLKISNVKYLGLLSPEKLRQEAQKATVGIVPFLENCPSLENSFPLKVFEYMACGLPVVSVKIKGLLPFQDVIVFASGVNEFKDAIQKAAQLRFDAEHSSQRYKAAKLQDYDIKFQLICRTVAGIVKAKKRETQVFNRKQSIAILYEPGSLHVNTIREHLESFYRFSRHEIAYFPATQNITPTVPLSLFSTVIVHYSVRLIHPQVVRSRAMLSDAYIDALEAYGGYKILFIQDEYDATNIARDWIKRLGFHTVFTCVPQQYLEAVYPKQIFPSIYFAVTLTGYVPSNLMQYTNTLPPSKRTTVLGYRGRILPYSYGNLGYEKYFIGAKAKELCGLNGITCDIEVDDTKRIYGADWYSFLGSCRATLGTESGSNLFDFNGDLKAKIAQKLKQFPELSKEAIFEEFVNPYETIKMNQISPKIFEAIALRTILILFEGEYSGVLEPDVHYISLKKDFSNFDAVLEKLNDAAFVDDMAEKSYNDIILSGKYSYQRFIEDFERILKERCYVSSNQNSPLMSISGYISSKNSLVLFMPTKKRDLPPPCSRVFSLHELQNFSLKRFKFKKVGYTSAFLQVIKFIARKAPPSIKYVVPRKYVKKVKYLMGLSEE